MIGDHADIVQRLKTVLPPRWFGESTPVLDALLVGYATAWSSVYSLLQYVKNQSRILTASDPWLDMIAQEFLGADLVRRSGEEEDQFRRRIQLGLFRERGTRRALHAALFDLTSREPVIFEPAHPGDTGGYGSMDSNVLRAGGGAAYSIAGGWGSLDLPFQFFVTAFRPVGAGIATVCGWGGISAGYGVGSLEYASIEMTRGRVTDPEILAVVARTAPAATIGWVRIVSSTSY